MPDDTEARLQVPGSEAIEDSVDKRAELTEEEEDEELLQIALERMNQPRVPLSELCDDLHEDA